MTKIARLHRNVFTASHSLGMFSYGETSMATIERPWLDNQRNISCIPNGEYLCKYLASSTSGKYKGVYHLQAVPNRSGILIHAGNFMEHSTGCIILGMRSGILSGRQAVLSSRSAIKKLREFFECDDFTLIITGAEG